MSISSRVLASAAVLSLVATTACTTNPETGNRRLSKAGIGALAGAALGTGAGAVVGGKSKRTEMIVGAGIGAIAGTAIGAYMDKQEKELREKTAGTDVEVIRQGDELLLNMPSGITFDTDSYSIKPEFRTTLDNIASTLGSYNQTYVDVYGHTDSTGADAYNMTLSRNRAESVAGYLATHGVARARIGTQGFGETQPVASNDTDAGRAQNRRVEIKLVPVADTNTQG
ncbi:OmpA family protein [Tardibacter chloracetimidivorans]|uniref:OmpA family protein n=1 Tax=Tardibacter chloracetimidivorans TaxID=1921510 RepID=UPI000B08DD7D|nr:OmpA family protein [Tardibacter chloracetimidivorans]